MAVPLEKVSFLGCGWAFPPRAEAAADLALVSDEEDVRQAILLILETAPGERVMRPDFGCGLRRLLFEPLNTTTMTLLEKTVEEALVAWEPRIDLGEVRAAPHPSSRGAVLIDIRYRVRSTNTFYNLVYPFYLQEQRA